VTELPPIRPEERSIWEQTRTIRIISIVLIAGCVLTAAGGFYLAAQGELNAKFTIDRFPAFYAVIGLVSFAFVVLIGPQLRKIVMRPEDYYDDPEPRPQPPDPAQRDGRSDEVAADDVDVGEEGRP
jgi:hypothetical protein